MTEKQQYRIERKDLNVVTQPSDKYPDSQEFWHLMCSQKQNWIQIQNSNSDLAYIVSLSRFALFARYDLEYVVHTIRKVKFLSKKSILTKPQHFHEFSPKFFLTIFLVKSKLSTAKKPKTTTFSRVFHPKKSTIFSGNQSWIFGQKMKISNCV